MLHSTRSDLDKAVMFRVFPDFSHGVITQYGYTCNLTVMNPNNKIIVTFINEI